tara:strand:+ start:400 stop:597 length:198 start_codon:yes stop_codon:yes gene_type:complete
VFIKCQILEKNKEKFVTESRSFISIMLYYYRKAERANNLPIQSGLKRSSCNKLIWVSYAFHLNLL